MQIGIYIGGLNKIENIIGILTIVFFIAMTITFTFTAILYRRITY